MRSLPLDEIRNEDHVQPDRSWLLENLGFLTSKHEINVGITRSKYGLIIVGKSLPNWILISCGVSFPRVYLVLYHCLYIGNKTLLRFDDTWKELIDHYEKRGCLLSEKEFPSKEDLKNCKTKPL